MPQHDIQVPASQVLWEQHLPFHMYLRMSTFAAKPGVASVSPVAWAVFTLLVSDRDGQEKERRVRSEGLKGAALAISLRSAAAST